MALKIERLLELTAHRIPGHRALNLNPQVNRIGEDAAKNRLFWGDENRMNLVKLNLGNQSVNVLKDDFEQLLQYLFAEQLNIAMTMLNQHYEKTKVEFNITKLQRLTEIWSRLLPNSKLSISAEDILVHKVDATPYSASEMSDGERSLFYLIGQVLAVESGQLIIIDEPELHIHPSIMSKLWDELEAQRPDCAFLFITHDLTFAKRQHAQKYVLREFRAEPQPAWMIEDVPQNSEFSEDLATLILGSRHPILFVEGTDDSLDVAFYRCCYPDWTVIPAGSCGEVIRAVKTLQNNSSFTRITCAGIVDNDHRKDKDIEALLKKNIHVLPVNEIENIILLPTVSKAILESELKSENYISPQLEEKLAEIKMGLLKHISCERNIKAATDRVLKRFLHSKLASIARDKTTKDLSIADSIKEQINDLNIDEIVESFEYGLIKAIEEENLPLILKMYDDKKMLAVASQILMNTNPKSLVARIKQNLMEQPNSAIAKAIKENLPIITQK
ncbi:DUF4435 domain-containing protein [Bartonella sp. HY038]|uniref:DUF4435 domain-containing protein n=1 Tax=Bartonella sp. HY038 TaxID=2759660 RepID=UPI00352CAD41